MPNLVRKVSMDLYTGGFLFSGKSFPQLWIPYGSITEFYLSAGSGWKGANMVQDLFNKKIININYCTEHQEKVLVKFEMAISAISPIINYRSCTALVGFLRQNGLLNVTVPADTVDSSADVIAQIEKLAKLHRSGTLTDEEFQSKKSELLKKI